MSGVLQQELEVNNLWLKYREQPNQDIREKLIEKYLPLVKIVAGRLSIGLPQCVDKDDLVSYGFFGLLESIDRYDPTRGIKFETYAVARIRGSILDALRAQDWIPVSVRQKAKKYMQTVAQLENELGRSARDEEIAVALKISRSELYELIDQINSTTLMPLEDFASVETSSTQQSKYPSDAVEIEETKKILAETIDKLPEKEKMVITLYYYEGLTLKEVSKVLNLSEARISQLHTKAIFRLRGALAKLKWSLL